MGLLDDLFSGGSGGGLLDFLRQNGLSQQFGSGLQSDQAQYGAPPQYAPRQFSPMPQSQPPMQQPPSNGGYAPQQQQPSLPTFLGGPSPSAGLGDRLNAGFQSFANGGSPLQSIAGGLTGLISGQRTDPLGMSQQNARAQFDAYKAAGMSPDKAMLAVLNPKAAEAFIAQIAPEYSAHNVDNVAGGFNKATGEFKPSFTATKYEKLGPGDNLVAVGGPGGKTGTVATGGPEKPSQGYRWVDEQDTSKGLEAIPGGPGTHLPSETAGRVAMMETGAADLPGARKTLMEGRGSMGTGVSGLVGATAGMGETGRANRTVRIAIEGALRAMTGAAAPEAEVKRYEDMFLPSPFDGKETATQKLNKLDDFISNAKRLVTQGRGPAGNAPAGRASDPLGIR